MPGKAMRAKMTINQDRKGTKKNDQNNQNDRNDGHHRDWWMWLDGTPEKKKKWWGRKEKPAVGADAPPNGGLFIYIQR